MMEEMNIPAQLKSILESLLLVSSSPIPLNQLKEILSEFDASHVEQALIEMQEEFLKESSGIDLVEVSGGYQFRTKVANSPWIFKLNKTKPQRLSRASLETLAIVAYRQPITRPEIDEIRGVDSGQVLRHLLERNLVRILGKREEPGNPLIYGTTKEFLVFFGLPNLGSLPSLREYTELGADSLAKIEKLLPPKPPFEGDLGPRKDLGDDSEVDVKDSSHSA